MHLPVRRGRSRALGCLFLTVALSPAVVAADASARTFKLRALQLVTLIRYVAPDGQELPPPGPGSPPIVGGRVTATTQDYPGTPKHHARRIAATDHLDCIFTTTTGMAVCNAQVAIGSSMITATDVTVDLGQPTTLSVPINGGVGAFRGAHGMTSLTRLGPNTNDFRINVTMGDAPAPAAGKPVGAVFTETNEPAGNRLVKFDRYANGTLRQRAAVATRGRGAPHRQPCSGPDCPILDTQGAVLALDDERLVLTTNAGSNTISIFRETNNGIKRLRVVGSHGTFPSSLTRHGNLVYVLNSISGTVAGFRLTAGGQLRFIKGSVTSLSTPGAGGNARQLGLDRTGRVLVVTQLVGGMIDTFVVGKDGRLGKAVPHASNTPLPFGFAFDPQNRLVLSTVTSLTTAGDTGVYDVSGAGGLTLVDSQSSLGAGPCWVAITRDGRYVFVSNTGGGVAAVVTRYGLGADGKLTFLGLTPPVAGEFARTDLMLSGDSRFLYVLAPDNTTLRTSHIDEYAVGDDGTLDLIRSTPSKLPAGLSGLAGR